MLNAKNARVCSDPVLPVKWLSDPSSASCLEQMLVRGVKMTKATKGSSLCLFFMRDGPSKCSNHEV